MQNYFNRLIDNVLGNPQMLIVSLIVAVAFVVGGIVLYVKRGKLKGRRWPGLTCTLLGCASLVTTAVQYVA